MEKGSISSDGSLVLPDSIREKLAISENTDVIFIETERGVEIVTKKRMLQWLRGCMKGKVSLDDFLAMRRLEKEREQEKMKRWEKKYPL